MPEITNRGKLFFQETAAGGRWLIEARLSTLHGNDAPTPVQLPGK
jgi:hypothetical protein